MQAEVKNKSLIEVARELIAALPAAVHVREIAELMEPKVSPEWVRKFIKGEIPNPGVITLEAFIKAAKAKSNV